MTMTSCPTQYFEYLKAYSVSSLLSSLFTLTQPFPNSIAILCSRFWLPVSPLCSHCVAHYISTSRWYSWARWSESLPFWISFDPLSHTAVPWLRHYFKHSRRILYNFCLIWKSLLWKNILPSQLRGCLLLFLAAGAKGHYLKAKV